MTERIPTVDDVIDIWDVTPLEAAIGAPEGSWLKYDEWGGFNSLSREFKGMANHLFFKGGELADIGRKIKPDVDSVKFHRCLRALLSSFSPKHQEKEATAGLFIQKYTDPL